MAASNGPPPSLFTLFTASVIGLIIYTIVKMVTAKVSPKYNRNDPFAACRNSETVTKDIVHDRRKLMRMNRDDRVKQLIRHHGGKNVSSAIKFLANELEKQRKILCENLLVQYETTKSQTSQPTCPYCLSKKKKLNDNIENS